MLFRFIVRFLVAITLLWNTDVYFMFHMVLIREQLVDLAEGIRLLHVSPSPYYEFL